MIFRLSINVGGAMLRRGTLFLYNCMGGVYTKVVQFMHIDTFAGCVFLGYDIDTQMDTDVYG